MLDFASPRALRATLMGPIAVRALSSSATGSVRAVFDRSFYIAFPEGWLCVGPARLGAGPLNILCDPWSEHDPRKLMKVGDFARTDNGAVRAGRISVLLDTAVPWHPQPVRAWTSTSLARGLATFAALLPPTLPAEGLAYLLHDTGGGESTVLDSAQPATRYLIEIFRSSERGRVENVDARRLCSLVGLGPGLTPSGDDYLGGFLIALSLTARFGLRDRTWHGLERHLSQRTNDISLAHLGAAAEGFGNAALHQLLNAILVGAADQIRASFLQTIEIGHTSGWDAIAGAIAVLRALNGGPNPTNR